MWNSGETLFKAYGSSRLFLLPKKRTESYVTSFLIFNQYKKIIYKLFNLDVNLKTVSWIKSFLLKRNQSVVVEGKQSEAVPFLSGASQGYVLGFLAYINELPDSLKSRTRLFADERLVYLTINSNSDPDTLQNDLYKLGKTCTRSSNEKQIGQWNLILINVKRFIY